MSAVKRKILESTLQRRVRARREPSEEPDYLDDSDDVSQEAGGVDQEDTSESDVEAEEQDSGNKSDGTEESDSDEETEEEDDAPELASSISFGALAKAQEILQNPSGKRKSGKDGKADDGWEDNEAEERKAGKKIRRETARADKHAPMEVSSKKAVSRRREVISVVKRAYRDPRFGPLNRPGEQSRFNKAYSFLDDYREDEMKALREQIKTTKNEYEKEELKRALLSMESKKKAEERKRREQEILDKHRKEEKQAVKEGKKPFYLKKSEQKKRVLLDQYSGLKGKQLDHVIERRRKKMDAKEKKHLPFARRNTQQ